MATNQKVRVMVVDDHAIFREGVARLLGSEPDIEVAATCGTLQEALAALKQHELDLLLLDFDLAVTTGAELQRRMRDTTPHVKVLFLTAGISDGQLREVMTAGACGIFLKNESPTLLAPAIRDVMQGRTWLSQTQAQLLWGAQPAGKPDSFTDKERAVLKRVVAGLSNKVIADETHASESAVKSILQQLFRKTGVRTRGQLVRVAVEQYRHLL